MVHTYKSDYTLNKKKSLAKDLTIRINNKPSKLEIQILEFDVCYKKCIKTKVHLFRWSPTWTVFNTMILYFTVT